MNARKWIKIYFIVLFLIGIIPYVFMYYFLKANYENNAIKDIVKRQINNNSIYGTALNVNTFSYKLELIKQTKPDIVAIGSSRVMQFRKENFNTSFINAGGGMGQLNIGYKLLEQIYKIHKPKFIILGLDFWWFNDNFIQPNILTHHYNDGDYINVNKIFRTFKWLLSGKIDISLLDNIFHNSKLMNKYTNYDNMGFSAMTKSSGYRSDGSYFYGATVFGVKKILDEKFNNTFNRINNGNDRFEYGSKLSKERILILKRMLSLIKKNKTKIILVIPPVANATYKKMINYEFREKYKFIKQLREFIKFLNVESYSYHNPSLITENDCEFIDGFHGGDIVYSRILKNIYNRNSSISKYINIININNNINLYKGNTLTINSINIFSKKEVDFLKIGCIKHSNYTHSNSFIAPL